MNYDIEHQFCGFRDSSLILCLVNVVAVFCAVLQQIMWFCHYSKLIQYPFIVLLLFLYTVYGKFIARLFFHVCD